MYKRSLSEEVKGEGAATEEGLIPAPPDGKVGEFKVGVDMNYLFNPTIGLTSAYHGGVRGFTRGLELKYPAEFGRNLR